MRKILVIGIGLVLLTSGIALAGKPIPPPSDRMELVGFTIATTPPNVGLFAMTQLCQAEFIDSRMCTSEEIMKTVNMPELPSNTQAWVQPVITGATFNGAVVIITDISGASYSSLSCNQWQSNVGTSYNGLVTNDKGQFQRKGCEYIIPVACCAPAQ